MEAREKSLLDHLPYLRRYARALMGSTERGDVLVAHALETLLGDPGTCPPLAGAGAAPRVPLYGLLNRLAGDLPPVPSDTQHPLEEALHGLPEIERRIYVLISLEELSFGEVAEALALPVETVRRGMARAQDRIRSRLTATILIVEDDAIIAYDLADTITAMGHRVCGTAATQEEALALARVHNPTLALMDLRLAHGDSGVTTAQALRERSALPIIFVTAFADDLHRRGLDHLGPVIRKPFTRDQIERAITQAVFTPRAAGNPAPLPG
jgi:DNA-directed RNA polymerase specialized sigma24 family protein